MFEAVEVGRKVEKDRFKELEPDLHVQLLALQRELRTAEIPLLIIVAGVEGAGKGDVVRRLNRWFDTRGIHNLAFWKATDEEASRPYYYRFWRHLPPRGAIAIMFGSWYTRPIIDHARGNIDDADLDHAMQRNLHLEQMLTDDGALIVKFWFHLSEKDQAKRLKQDAKDGVHSHLKEQQQFARDYRQFAHTAERSIRLTDTASACWHLIESTDRRYRDLAVGQVLVKSIETRLANHHAAQAAPHTHVTPTEVAGASQTILDHVDQSVRVSNDQYARRLKELKAHMRQLSWAMHEARHNIVCVFEGWDAAGKGGNIRRLLAAVDPRLYRVVSIAAPTDEELARHYLWRFWRHVPAGGRITIFDRSWYGRVLVERVEGFAREDEWQRAYIEINDFEEQLTEHGIQLHKFWIHISKGEQLRRFKEREQIAWKQHKITDEDWRNREKWPLYEQAINEMVARTSTEFAPWTLVAGNSKHAARMQVLRAVSSELRRRLDKE